MKLLIAASALVASAPAIAATFHDLAAIDREVASFIGADPGNPGGAALPVDRRLRLAACTQPLALSWYGARRESVLVQCLGAGWRVFVPLRTPPQAAQSAPAVVRGEAVTIVVRGDGFALSQPGEAVEAGAVGAWIRVRIAGSSGTPLRAQVLRPGVVGMDLP